MQCKATENRSCNATDETSDKRLCGSIDPECFTVQEFGSDMKDYSTARNALHTFD